MNERALTLSVVGAKLPAGVRDAFTFGQSGGSIGRGDDCDWVLAAPGISRVHAVVRCIHGLYFLEDRSTNGMLRNGVQMARGEPVTLADGDRLQLDSFELVARVVDAQQSTPTIDTQAAFDSDRTIMVSPPPSVAAPSQSPTAANVNAYSAGRVDDFWDFGLGASASTMPASNTGPGSAAELDDASWDFAVASPPASMPSMPAAGTTAVDAGADLDALLAGFGGAAAAPQLDPLQLFDPPPMAAATASDHWNHTPSTAGHYQPPRNDVPAALLPEEWDLTQGNFSGSPVTAPIASPPPPSAVAPPAAQPLPADVEAILRIVVDGVMDVLRARAEIKNTFRLPVTIIQRSENNPLKFAATPDEAMRRLLQPDGAFLSGTEAFDDAFDDIRCHQMAMLSGMRAAFESLLAHFSPERIERDADANGRRLFAGKGRCWDRYRDEFARAAKDPDSAFRMLFGDEFARAYEAQLGRLKSARRRHPR